MAAPAWAAPGFDNERPAGYDVTPKHQSNWEPTVAVDPGVPARVYQLITGISATACKGPCPGTSILFRRSIDGGATFGRETFVCASACKGIGWQYDPQIRVANDTNAVCHCGTIFAAFLDECEARQIVDVHQNSRVREAQFEDRNEALTARKHLRPIPVLAENLDCLRQGLRSDIIERMGLHRPPRRDTNPHAFV